MPVEIFDVEQNSDAWIKLRAGLITASEFSSVLAKGEGKVRSSYMRKLAAERITGEPLESYTNAYMARGHEQEDQARKAYAFLFDAAPISVGFVKNGIVGCSPDSFLGDHGLLEIKTQKADLLIETIERGTFPSSHRAQVQGMLWVCERQWCDLIVYAPKMTPFIKREIRDERFIGELAREVERFDREVGEMVDRVSRYVPD
jgi:hypothetical protein